MARTKKIIQSAAFVAAVSLGLAACGGGFSEEQAEESDQEQDGGSSGQALVIGTINPPASFNPINQTDVGGQWANEFILDSLLVQPSPLNFQPSLADSFDTEDNQTFTISLNPDANWSDGEPFTAEDVAFTLNLVAHPDSLTAVGTNISALDGVDSVTGKLPEGESEIPGVTIIDDHTLELRTQDPVDPNLIYELIGSRLLLVPEHHLSDIEPSEFGESDFAQMPDVTSGPYTVENYSEGTSIEFTARDDYYRDGPLIDDIVVRMMPASNLAGDLQTGAIHMNSGGGIGNIPIRDLSTVEGLDNVTSRMDETLGVQFIYFNTDKITDQQMRQAIAHSINREQIVDQLLEGNGEIVDGPYTSQSPYLDTGLEPLAYDPDMAESMLEDSEYDGETLEFLVPTGNAVREQSAAIMVQNFEAIGLSVEQSNVDFPTLLSMARAGDYDMLLIGNTFNVDPDMRFMLGSQGSSNYMFYDSDEVDGLLADGVTEPDPAERERIYHELQAIWQEELPLFGLYSDNNAAVVSNDLAVGGPAEFWRGSLANLPEWSFGNM